MLRDSKQLTSRKIVDLEKFICYWLVLSAVKGEKYLYKYYETRTTVQFSMRKYQINVKHLKRTIFFDEGNLCKFLVLFKLGDKIV